MGTRTDQVIEAVRQLDALEARRRKITEGIDREIAELRTQIAELVGEAKPRRRSGRESRVGVAALDVLRANPRAGNGEIAVKVYGNDTPQNRHKARATIFNLKTSGRIKALPDGSWEITEPVANGTGASMH
jgi:hypothetical protein